MKHSILLATILVVWVGRLSAADALPDSRSARTNLPLADFDFTGTVSMTFKPFPLDRVTILEGRVKDELETNRRYWRRSCGSRHKTVHDVPYRNEQNKGGQYGSMGGWSLISGSAGSQFGWDMKVRPDSPMTVGIIYSCRQLRPVFSGFASWCNCPAVASFDLLVNGRVIATRTPDPSAEWKPFEEFPILAELTRGRETVTVTFKPHPNGHVRVYGCIMAKARGKDDP